MGAACVMLRRRRKADNEVAYGGRKGRVKLLIFLKIERQDKAVKAVSYSI